MTWEERCLIHDLEISVNFLLRSGDEMASAMCLDSKSESAEKSLEVWFASKSDMHDSLKQMRDYLTKVGF